MKKQTTLVVNAGSSSIKCQVLEMPEGKLLAKIRIEKIWESESIISYKNKLDSKKIKQNEPIANHKEGLDKIINLITDQKDSILDDLSEISIVGHRVVHGGEYFSQPTLITKDVLNKIQDCEKLAPLHNPANKMGIQACQELIPEADQIAVFDTAFHQSMDPANYIYPIPYKYYEKHKIRRYGFHGTSHKYIIQQTKQKLSTDSPKIISAHIGNGASICAYKDNQVVETSMWFTPLEGLMMGTRSWDIDPAIVAFLADQENKTAKDIENILNKESGVLGVFEKSNDLREVENAYQNGDSRAKLTLKLYSNSIAKYIGSYLTLLNWADAIAFTAGVWENSDIIRKMVLDQFEYVGVSIDEEKNQNHNELISTKDSKIKAFIIPTNEEYMIAKESYELVN